MTSNGFAAILAALAVTALPTIAGSSEQRPSAASGPPADIRLAEAVPDYPGDESSFTGSWFPKVKPKESVNLSEDGVLAVEADDIPEVPQDAQYRVQRGDTFKAVLLRAGVAPADAERAIRALSKVYNPRKLRPGVEIFLQLQPQKKDKTPALLSIDFIADPQTDVSVLREGDGSFTAKTYERTLTPRLAHGRATIRTSLYNAGQEAGVPSGILNSLVNLYSFDVDFQRDVQRGDSFELIYQRLSDEGGTRVLDGDVLMATMTLSGATTTLYRFKTKTGYTDYFDEDGQSAQKTLLRTPTDATRISSGFGRRRHPILGYTRMHRGIDFAAPAGTPVYAAGDGVIEKAGWAGAYGKYIRIRHGGNFKTAYAHLRRYASGIKAGVRVKQRQVIGYVGSTGRSTGPHLHYEVIKNGKQVNPQKLRLAAGYSLKGAELKKFRKTVAEVKGKLEVFRKQLAQKPN